jgi:hypothetical protein
MIVITDSVNAPFPEARITAVFCSYNLRSQTSSWLAVAAHSGRRVVGAVCEVGYVTTPTRIVKPEGFFRELAWLHDAAITSLLWVPAERRLVLTVEDLQANFKGLPDYSGPDPASIRFETVVRFECKTGPFESRLSVQEMLVRVSASGELEIDISTWQTPARLTIHCSTVSVLREPDERGQVR